MTKEELLRGSGILKGNGFIWGSYIPSAHVYNLLEVMDEYAKQQAIEFVKWAIDAEKIVGDNWGIAFMPLMEEDVYNQFIEQQNKDNG